MYIILHQFFCNCTKRWKVFHLSFFRNHYSCVSEIQCTINILFFCSASPHFLAMAFPICFLHPSIFHAGENLWHPSKQHSPKRIRIVRTKLDTALVREFLISIAKCFKYSILFNRMKRYISRTWIEIFILYLISTEKIKLKLCLCLCKDRSTKVCKLV